MDLSSALFVIRNSVKLLRLGFANYDNTRFGLRVCSMRLIGCVSKILTAALGKLHASAAFCPPNTVCEPAIVDQT